MLPTTPRSQRIALAGELRLTGRAALMYGPPLQGVFGRLMHVQLLGSSAEQVDVLPPTHAMKR